MRTVVMSNWNESGSFPVSGVQSLIDAFSLSILS